MMIPIPQDDSVTAPQCRLPACKSRNRNVNKGLALFIDDSELRTWAYSRLRIHGFVEQTTLIQADRYFTGFGKEQVFRSLAGNKEA